MRVPLTKASPPQPQKQYRRSHCKPILGAKLQPQDCRLDSHMLQSQLLLWRRGRKWAISRKKKQLRMSALTTFLHSTRLLAFGSGATEPPGVRFDWGTHFMLPENYHMQTHHHACRSQRTTPRAENTWSRNPNGPVILPKTESIYINCVVVVSLPRLSASYFIVFIDLATLLESSITGNCVRENNSVTEGEHKCAEKDGDDAAEGLSITTLFFLWIAGHSAV